MPQEHERGVGGWHAEATTIAALVQATGAALAAMAHVMETLRVDPERMRANIAATRGVVFAERALMLLTPALGREAANRIITYVLERTREDGRDFVETLAATPEVTAVLRRRTCPALVHPKHTSAPRSSCGSDCSPPVQDRPPQPCHC